MRVVDKNKNTPNFPDDASQLFENLAEQGAQRLQAIRAAYNQIETAKTARDKKVATANLGRMLGELEQFRVDYPGIIPDEEA